MRKFLHWTGQRVADAVTGVAVIAAVVTLTIAIRWLIGLTGSAEPVVRLVLACTAGLVMPVLIGALVRPAPRRGAPAPPSPPEERLGSEPLRKPKWWETATDDEIRAQGFRNPAAVRCMGPLKAAAAQDRADDRAARVETVQACGVPCTEVPSPLTQATGLMRMGRCALPAGHPEKLHDPFPEERGARAMPLMIEMPEGGVPDAVLAELARREPGGIMVVPPDMPSPSTRNCPSCGQDAPVSHFSMFCKVDGIRRTQHHWCCPGVCTADSTPPGERLAPDEPITVRRGGQPLPPVDEGLKRFFEENPPIRVKPEEFGTRGPDVEIVAIDPSEKIDLAAVTPPENIRFFRDATDDEVRAALMGEPLLDGVEYPELTADEAAALFEDCRCATSKNPPCGPCENGTVHPEGK